MTQRHDEGSHERPASENDALEEHEEKQDMRTTDKEYKCRKCKT